jgi:gliding motility-associated-like protein
MHLDIHLTSTRNFNPITMKISLLQLRNWGIALLTMIPFIAFSANIAIIESQSNHPMQTMDVNWYNVALSNGHTATILPQTALDALSNFDNYDVLIVSSGLINLPTNRRETVKSFFNTGRNIYLQSEFLLTHPGNMMFAEIVLEHGDAFTWLGESSGNVSNMAVICGLGNILNTVTTLNYFWYGTYGAGDNSIIPFLKNNNKYYGFTYHPNNTSLGRLITTTDQDWVRILASEDLMENIVFSLATQTNSNTIEPTVAISLDSEPDCENGLYTFTTDVQNAMSGLEYQWQINGVAIPNTNSTTFTSNDLMDGDVVECVIAVALDCQMYSHQSNPVLITPILPVSELTFGINSNQTNTCFGAEIIFSSNIQSAGNYTIIDYQWQVNNQNVIGANSATFVVNNLANNDVVSCNLQYTDNCNSLQLSTSNAISINVNASITPSIQIAADNTNPCAGESITFTTQGSNWGATPTFQWKVNGIIVGNNENILSINSLQDGDQVTCTLLSSEDCLTTSSVTSAGVIINIATPLVPALTISADQNLICANEMVTFTASGVNWGNNPFFAWSINGQPAGNNEPVFSSNTLTSNDVVACTIYLSDPCLSTNELSVVAENFTILEVVTPIITISSTMAMACAGTEITFSANSQNGGDNPIYQWLVDNVPTGNNSATFSTTTLSNNQVVSCQLISDAYCLSTASVVSNEIGINISDITLIVNQKIDDYCGLGKGKIQVGANYGIGTITYSWNTGVNTTILNNLSAGTYTVTATDALGCSTTLSVSIEETAGLEIARLDVQPSTCGQHDGAASVVMADMERTYFYTWMTADGTILGTDPLVRDLTFGSYLLEIADDTGCFLLEEFVVGGSNAVTIDMDERMQINWGEQVKLEPYITGSGNLTFEWSPAAGLSCADCPNPIITTDIQTEYTLTVSSEDGCSETKSILIIVRKEHEVFIPSAFSPNGDGKNDAFTAFAGDKVKQIKAMKVLDRWGSVLYSRENFDANDEAAGWDGTSMGKRLNVGVYLYLLEVEFIDGFVRTISGDVTLAR